MKKTDLQNKSKEELTSMLKDLKSRRLQLNFELGEKRLKDFSQVNKTKREIARILTKLNQENVPTSSRILDDKAIGRK